MKDHLLSRLYGYEYNGDEHLFTDDERNDLRIVGGLNQVIESTILWVNYTTYDICREQDVMRPGPACFAITLLQENSPNAHPFWYCQVIRVFHISVLHVGPNAWSRSPQIMELLWVHWLGVEPGYNWGLREAQLLGSFQTMTISPLAFWIPHSWSVGVILSHVFPTVTRLHYWGKGLLLQDVQVKMMIGVHFMLTCKLFFFLSRWSWSEYRTN